MDPAEDSIRALELLTALPDVGPGIQKVKVKPVRKDLPVSREDHKVGIFVMCFEGVF